VYPPVEQLTLAGKEGELYLLDLGNELIFMLMRKEAQARFFGGWGPGQLTEALLGELDSDEGRRMVALVDQLRACKPNWWARVSFALKTRMGPIEQRFYRGMILDKHPEECGDSYHDLYNRLNPE
jgi:hypothetical protein